MLCISTFLEKMDHEFPAHKQVIVERSGYKVDGKGIKDNCQLNTLKSVDYYELNDTHGFLYVEFSDLLRQNEFLKNKIARISASNLSKEDKRQFRKELYQGINKELVHKYKDSVIIKNLMRSKIENIPYCFDNSGIYMIVVAPFAPDLNKDKVIEFLKFLDTLKDKVAQAIPKDMYSSVKILPLDKFCNQ